MELNWTSSLHFPRKRQLDSTHSWMGSQVFCSLNIQVYNCLYFWESDRIILLIEPMCRTCVTLTLLRFHLSKAKWSICHWCERMQIIYGHFKYPLLLACNQVCAFCTWCVTLQSARLKHHYTSPPAFARGKFNHFQSVWLPLWLTTKPTLGIPDVEAPHITLENRECEKLCQTDV